MTTEDVFDDVVKELSAHECLALIIMLVQHYSTMAHSLDEHLSGAISVIGDWGCGDPVLDH